MKKILKFVLPIVIAAALGTTGIFVFKDNTEYYVDTTYFRSIYAYKDDIDLSGLKIIETEKDEIKAEHQVEESMVTSCDSTNSVGEKTLVLTYEKEVFTVNFIVMYEIKFISDNEVYDLQYVLKASEIKTPKEPKKSGYEFKGWSPEVPNVINDNMTFEAVFSDTPESIPNLGVYEATYGDTLESIKLPSNQYGSWKFVDELTTKVGNVGTNTFDVEFIPTNSELKVIKDTVQIAVGKKTLEFKNVVTTFDYDGEEHLPTYELEVEGLNVVTMGTPGVEVGSYFIMYVIQDDNYEGQWQGSFSIVASEISISFDITELSEELESTDAYYSIELGEEVPSKFLYTVTGIANPDLLQLKLNVPKVNHAGTYDVTLTVGNTSYKNVKIVNKCYLVVEKTSLGAGLPELTTKAIYGNKLSSVTFEDNNPNGVWTWENPDYVFEYAGEHVVKLVFTPHSLLDYSIDKVDVTLMVEKRELVIEILNDTYTYQLDEDGNPIERSIEYKVLDGEIELTNINVVNQVIESKCGKYDTVLTIEEDNYFGSIPVSLRIEQATPVIDWESISKDSDGSYLFEVVIGTSLKDITNMPNGISWVSPSTITDKAGVIEYDAIYTPEDTDNFKSVEGKLTVNVVRKEAEITVSEEHSFVYGEQVKLDAVFSHNESEAIYKYYLDGHMVDKISDVGIYTVIIELPQSYNYNFATATTTVEITKKVVELSWKYNKEYVYQDRVISKPVASFFGVTDSYIELDVIVYNTLTNEVVDFKNAGSYYFVADTSYYTNYEFSNVEIKDIVVAKAKIDLNEYSWNYTKPISYDGLEHKVEVLNLHEALEPVYLENVKVNAGKYVASVTFTYDQDNYELIGEISACEWEIISSTVAVEWSYEEEYVFTGHLLALPKATILDGTVELTVTVEDDKVFRNAGSYNFVASLENGNYALSNNTLNDIVVEKVSLNVEWIYEESYIYTGDTLFNPIAKVVDLLGVEVALDINESSSKAFRNAGEYRFIASFAETYDDAKNYELTNTVSELVEILKADYNLTNMAWNYEQSFVYNSETHTVELINVIEGLTPYYTNNSAINAGEYLATVTFGYDETNYNEPSFDSLSWTIEAKVVEVEWTYEEEYIYSESILVSPTATYTKINEEKVALVVVEENNKEFKETGKYTFVASIADDLDANNYELSNSTLEVEVTKTKVSISELSATYGDTLEDVQLPISEFGNWEFVNELTTSVGDVGFNVFEVKFNSTSENYESYVTTAVINVARKTVVIKVEENEFTYDGTNKTLAVVVLDGEEVLDIKVLGNVVANNASTISTTLSINEKNYQADVVEAELVINKAVAVITNNLTVNSSDYDGNEIDLSKYFTLNHDEIDLDINVTVTRNTQVIKDAGVYNLTITAAETANYLAAEPINVTYTVNQVTPNLVYTVPESGYTYNGSAISLDNYISHVNSDEEASVTYVYQFLEGSTYVSVDAIVEAGTYKVVASIASTINFIEEEIEFTVVVEKGTFNVDELEAIDAVYGQQLNHFEFATVEGGSWAWVNPTDYVGDAGTRTHKAIFTPNDESLEVVEKDVTFNVQPKPITIILVQKEFTYDGNEHTVTYTLSENPEGVTVGVTGTITATDYVEGGYAFTLEITGNANYTGSIDGVLVIKKADLQLTVPSLTAVYGQTLKDVTFPTADNGTWSFVSELSTSVGNAGSRNFAVKFTPNSTNYNEKTLYAVIMVAKADYSPTAIPTIYDAVYGDLLSTLTLPTDDTNGTWRWDSNGTVGNVGVNTFTATFTHSNANYNSYQASVTVNVAKADSVITNSLPAKLVYTGSELIEQYFTLNHKESNLVFTVTGKRSSVVNAGTYQVVVSVAESANYNAATLESIEVVVAKATPTTDFSQPFTYTYGKVLSNDDLPTGYEWINLMKLEVGANQQVAAKFTPTDTENYEIVTKYFVVTIEKIVGTITVVSNQQFTYGDVIDLGAVTNNADGNTIVSDINPVDAGKYTVTLTVAESAHYTAASVTVNVTINQKEEEIELPETFEYGTTIEEIVPTKSEYGEFTVYETNPSDLSSYSVSYNSVPNDLFVSTKTIWVKFTPYAEFAKNYAEFIEEVTITIVKKELKFEKVNSVFTYDGNPHSVDYELIGLVAGDVVSIDGDISIVNVKESTSVTLTIVSDYYYGSWSGNLTIVKAVPTTDFTKVYDAYWNTKLSDIELPVGYTFEVDQTLNKIGKGQTFKATYTPTDTDNYEIVKSSLTVNVNKLVTEITITNATSLTGLSYIPDKTYTVTATASSGAATTITVNGAEEYTISNAGTYTVIITSEETDYYQAGYKEYTIEIAKAIPENSSFDAVLIGTWGNTLSSVSLTSKYSWNNPDELLDIIGEKKYSATYTPEDTDNYATVTVEITINIKKAVAEINVKDNQTFGYGSTIDLGATTNNSDGASIEMTIVSGGTELVEVGSYTVVISLPETEHFEATSETITVVIEKATPNLDKLSIVVFEDKLNHEDYSDLLTGIDHGNISGTFEFLDNPEFKFPLGNTERDFIKVVNIKFSPNDTAHYNEVIKEFTVTIRAIAHVNGKNYGTIEAAVEEASSGSVIWVYAGVDAIIKGDIELVNKTLVIPYADNTRSNVVAVDSGNVAADYLKSLTPITTVTLASDKMIKLDETSILEIGGKLSGGGGGSAFSGHTSSEFATLKLGQNAKIESYGTINAFGYIEEAENTTGSGVIAHAGQVCMPFILRDFKGGSFMYGVYNASNKESSPFRQFEMRNITSKLVLRYNASLNVWANLYAGDKQNQTTINFIGNTETSFIQLTDQTYSYAEIKYDPGTEIQQFDIYGGAKTNNLKLTVKISLVIFEQTVNLNMADYYFPLSWRFRLSLNANKNEGQTNANYYMAQKYKVLPGGVLAVNEGAYLEINELTVYENWTETLNYGGDNYGHGLTLEPGKFIVNGSAKITNFAGNVTSNTNGAKLHVEKGTTITTYEAKVYGTMSISEWDNISEDFNLKMLKNGVVSEEPVNCQSGTYYSMNGGWISSSIKITKKFADETTASDEEIDSSSLYIPEDGFKEGYQFIAWYVDDKLWSEVYPEGIYEDVILTAKYEKLDFNINYDLYNYYNTVGSDNYTVEYNEEKVTFNRNEGIISFGMPTHSAGFTLKGLYINSISGTPLRIVDINGIEEYQITSEELFAEIVDNQVTIFAVWYDSPVTINFINSNTDEQITSIYEVEIRVNSGNGTINKIGELDVLKSYLLPDFTKYNLDKTYSKYFAGWKYGDVILSSLSELSDEVLQAIIDEETSIINLEAVWYNKKYITINYVYDNNINHSKYDNKSENYYIYSVDEIASIETRILPAEYNADESVEWYNTRWMDSNGTTINVINDIAQVIFDNETINVYAEWLQKTKVTYYNEENVIIDSIFVVPNNEYSVKTISSVKKTGYNHQWLVTGGNKNGNKVKDGDKIDYTSEYGAEITLKVEYEIMQLTVKISTKGGEKITIKYDNVKIECGTTDKDDEKSQTTNIEYNKTISIIFNYSDKVEGPSLKVKFNGSEVDSWTDTNEHFITLNTEGTVEIIGDKEGGQCFAEGTLVNMADGTMKPIELLEQGDELLVFNHIIGKIESAPASMIIHYDSERENHEVMNLLFDNNSTLRIVGYHGLFDVTLNNYIYVSKDNIFDYIGHEFYLSNGNTTTLDEVYFTNENVRIYSPLSANHLNCFVEGILTITNFSEAIFEIFEYEEDMRFDMEVLQNDINKYGLFTYEDFKDYVPYELYCQFPAQYIKIAIAKGVTTFDEIIYIIYTFLLPSF